jgi:hypothetical protein
MKKRIIYLFFGVIFGLIALLQSCSILKNIDTESTEIAMLKTYTLWQLGKILGVQIENNTNSVQVAKKVSIKDFEQKFWKTADSCVVKFHYHKTSADSMLVTFQLQRHKK